MTLERGARLGHYEVQDLLGAGGMGAVYRALDKKLGREVALKVLLDEVSRDSERRARFQREARLLAQVNHPNIATLHGYEEASGVSFLVMELVAGETLAERLDRGRLSWEELRPLAIHLADALEAAHERGIVHRDLKPSNLKVTPEGTVKVLDFGLAKPFGDPAVGSDSHALTLSRNTTEGVITGTVSYMSPEQARGLAVDRRTDIWAFGCVLYEALSGKPAFGGETVADVLSSILGREPDWAALPRDLPPSIQELLRSTLRKDARQRLRDAGDARLQLEAAGSVTTATEAGTRPRTGKLLVAALVLTSLGIAAGFLMGRRGKEVGIDSAARLEVLLPSDQRLFPMNHVLTLAPDGRDLVYQAGGALYRRPLDRWEATLIPGTEGARTPFFSPDGKWLGFWADGELRKVSIDGGPPITLCRAQSPLGVSWGAFDRIVFGQGPAGIFEVSADGGEARLLVRPDLKKGEVAFHGPELLPGGEAVLFTLLPAGRNWNGASACVQRLATGERKIVLDEATDARYLETGHLVFSRGTSLLAVVFDRETFETRGPPIPIAEDVLRGYLFSSGAGQFSFSKTGVLAYAVDVPWHDMSPVWVDRKGVEELISVPPRRYQHARISPDGGRALVDSVDSQDLWLYELDRGTMSRLTVEQTFLHPVWSPDGSRVVFDATAGHALYWTAADGSTPPELLLTDAEAFLSPVSISPDGRFLAFERSVDYVTFDIGILPLEGDRVPRPLLATAFHESAPVFSPDGRWLAYVSNETGRYEVYVQAFPGPGGKRLISNGGGREPLWSRTGDEIFYRNGRAMMAVPVATGSGFAAGSPRKLFEGAYNIEPISAHPVYDVSGDGRFLMVKSLSPLEVPRRIRLVLDGLEELKRDR
jgi:serine/threonine-protein kinase